MSAPLARVSVWSRNVLPSIIEPSRASEQGTIGRSSVVANTIASDVSVRTVATCVEAAIVTTSGWGAESQKVTDVRAAVGGNRLTPMSSRNFT